MSGGFCAQLALVLRKNLIFKKRNRNDVLLEILFPCLFFLLLGALKSNVGTANQFRPLHVPGISILHSTSEIDTTFTGLVHGHLDCN